MTMTKEEKKIYNKWYRQTHKEEIKIYQAWYDQTPKAKMNKTIGQWKFKGLISDDYELIYNRYLISETCEECNKPYTTKNKKCMDHNHETGTFRNILCNACNTNRRMKINTSGIPNISWDKRRNTWRYTKMINGKLYHKSSRDLEFLKQYKIDFEKEHYY